MGYLSVKLYLKSNKRTYPVHRLIAMTFLENDKNKPCVNHIDGNKLNNIVDNLEWCTYSENTKHAYKTGLEKISEKQRESGRRFYKLGSESNSKKVNQYDLNGKLIRKWNSISEANRSFQKTRTRINDVCNGKAKQSMGFIWKFEKEKRRNNH